MNNISKIIDKMTEKVSDFLSIMLFVMIMLVFISVFFRFTFNISSVAAQELVMYIHALVFMFGISYTLKENAHVQIDIIYNRLSVKLKSMLSIFGLFIFVLPTSFFIIYISIDMVAQSWSILEGSSEAGGMDLVFILKSFIPIMGILISIQTVSEIIKYFKAYKNER